MVLFYQILLAVSTILMAGLWVYGRRLRRRLVKAVAFEKQQALNLRRELHDTTEKLHQRQESLQFFRQLLQRPDDAILTFPLRNNREPAICDYMNAAAVALFEIEDENPAKLQCHEIEAIPESELATTSHDHDRPLIGSITQQETATNLAQSRIQQQIKALLEGRQISRSTRIITQQQHIVHVNMQINLAQRGKENFMVYTLRNEQTLRQTRKLFELAEKRYQDLFQSSLIGIAFFDGTRTLQRVNPAWLRIFGSPSVDEIRQVDLFNPPIIPEERRDQLNRGESLHVELEVDFNDWIKQLGFVTSRRHKVCLDLFFRNLGRDNDQHSIGYIVQVMDLTDLREKQGLLARREAQLLQASKMEAIGMMTGGIAHDFNNILTPILGYSEIGLDFCADNPTLQDFIKEIHIASLRARELVSQILIYSRQSEEDVSAIHLMPIIKEVAKQQAAVLAPKITVRATIRTKDDLVMANPTQMHQVMTNLATNAAYAMRATGGSIDILLTTFNLGWRHRQEFPQLQRGHYVRLTIRDTGPGVTEDIRERIFDPFFSTKPHGEGTGMGLAVVKSIIDSVGGAIAVESTSGEGATFHVAIPLLQVEHHDTITSWTPPPATGKTILFVDDEASIARMAKPLLESIGYIPIVCPDCHTALQVLEDPRNRIDLLLTDQVMPESNGLELAIAARAIRPQLPIVVCTGYPEKLDIDKARAAGILAIIHKPASRQDLSDVLACVLRGENLLAAQSEQEPSGQPPEQRKDSHEAE